MWLWPGRLLRDRGSQGKPSHFTGEASTERNVVPSEVTRLATFLKVKRKRGKKKKVEAAGFYSPPFLLLMYESVLIYQCCYLYSPIIFVLLVNYTSLVM